MRCYEFVKAFGPVCCVARQTRSASLARHHRAPSCLAPLAALWRTIPRINAPFCSKYTLCIVVTHFNKAFCVKIERCQALLATAAKISLRAARTADASSLPTIVLRCTVSVLINLPNSGQVRTSGVDVLAVVAARHEGIRTLAAADTVGDDQSPHEGLLRPPMRARKQ